MEQIPKSGSNRHYFRLTSLEGGSVIGVVNHDVEENRCFIYLFEQTFFGAPSPRARNIGR